MRWIEASIPTKSEEIDGLCTQLAALGVEGVSVEDEADFTQFLENNRRFWDYVDEELNKKFAGQSCVKFYVADDPEGNAHLLRVQTALAREITLSYIEDEDWANSWKQYYEPLPIGERLLIVPDWLEAEASGRVVLRLDPGIAFGTGSHATTRMCLEALETVAESGKSALDLGCGSGILGIAALLLGCSRAVGCDIDPKSPDAARMNAALNGITDKTYRVCAGDLLSDESVRQYLGGGYDIVLANIVADVIIPLSGFVQRFLAPDGVLICSGIIDDRAEETANALQSNGFVIREHLHEEEWHAFVCVRDA